MNDLIINCVKAIRDVLNSKANLKNAYIALDEACENECNMLDRKNAEEERMDNDGYSPAEYAIMEDIDLSGCFEEYESSKNNTKMEEEFVKDSEKELKDLNAVLINRMIELQNEIIKRKFHPLTFEFDDVKLSLCKEFVDENGEKCKRVFLELKDKEDEEIWTTAIIPHKLYKSLKNVGWLYTVKGHIEKESITLSYPMSVEFEMILDVIKPKSHIKTSENDSQFSEEDLSASFDDLDENGNSEIPF